MRNRQKGKLLLSLMAFVLVIAACGDDDTAATTAATTADTTAATTADTTAATTADTTAATTADTTADTTAGLPGEGVSINMGRADWSTGYFQAYVYQQVLEELGYDVTNPSETELGPSLAYLGMAQGDFDFWVNSWYPGHDAWLEAEMPDGSMVGDHLEIPGPVFDGGGIQGWLIEKNFADEFGLTTMEEFNSNPDAIAAYDAVDPVPGNGLADIYGCQESYTCDNMIQNMIAFGGWDNIQQTIAGYDPMFAEAEAKVADGDPVIIYTWTPSTYVARLIPGVNVYWLGTESVLDDSNPANQDGGAGHDMRQGPTGLTSFVGIPASQCPAAANTDDGLCPMGWVPASVSVTANASVLAANPAFAAALSSLQLPVVDVSLATVAADAEGGTEEVFARLASEWIADNRDIVDAVIAAALAAA